MTTHARVLQSRFLLTHLLVLTLALLLGAIVAHCMAAPTSPALAPVSGKVTYEDGGPVPGARIQIVFLPLVPEGQTSDRDRPSIADVDVETGEFKFTSTYEEKDGTTVGMHRVMVTVLGPDGELNGAVSRVFSNPKTSPLKIEIENRKNWIHFQLPRP